MVETCSCWREVKTGLKCLKCGQAFKIDRWVKCGYGSYGYRRQGFRYEYSENIRTLRLWCLNFVYLSSFGWWVIPTIK